MQKSTFWALAGLLLLPVSLLAADDPLKGRQLFLSYCQRCHAMQEQVVGPPLKEVHRYHTTDWMNRWVRNPGAVIRSGDAYAVKLFEQYQHLEMPPFEFLSRQDVLDIGAYILQEGGRLDSVAALPSTGTGEIARRASVAPTGWQLHAAPPELLLVLSLLALVIALLGLFILFSL